MTRKFLHAIFRNGLLAALLLTLAMPVQADLASAQQAWLDKQYDRAFSLFLQLAKAGNDKAMNNVAAMYQYGQGTGKDPAQALYWYKQAVKKGNVAALTNLGYLYDNGVGVKKDTTRAYELYRQAARKGHAQGQYNLGVAYFQGVGVVRNRILGYAWIGVAASQGLPVAMKTMKMLDFRMPPLVIKDGRELIPKFYERYVVPYKEKPR